MSRAEERKRAIELKALDAHDMLFASVPYALNAMSWDQIDQVQRVLDAEVVNEEVEKKAKAIEGELHLAVKEHNNKGQLVYANPEQQKRFEHRFDGRIPVKGFTPIRLDHWKLMTPDALEPETDNPDEAEFLLDAIGMLEANGVWLRVYMPLVPKNGQPDGQWRYDSRTFKAWLSLGRGDDEIKSGRGQLNRRSLFDNITLGSAYSRRVTHGRVREELKKSLNRIERELTAGEQQHAIIGSMRRTAGPGVIPVTAAVNYVKGKPNYPDPKIWEGPRQTFLKAWHALAGGKVLLACKLALLSAVETEIAAQQLKGYIDAFITTSSQIVGILSVVRTTGKIAEYLLLIIGAGQIVVRRLAAHLAARAAARSAAAPKMLPAPGAPPVTHAPIAHQNTHLVAAETTSADTIVHVARPPSVTLDSFVSETAIHGQSVRDAEALGELMGGAAELTARGASLEEKLAFLERYFDKWGRDSLRRG